MHALAVILLSDEGRVVWKLALAELACEPTFSGHAECMDVRALAGTLQDRVRFRGETRPIGLR
jgi:hypothetical protein